MFKLILRELSHILSVFFVDGLLIHYVRSPHKKKRLLLIRLDAIGDFYLWLDTAGAYRKIYPNHHITLLGNSIWSSYAKHFSYWDNVWSINVEKLYVNPFYRLKILSKIRKIGFQIAIQTVVPRRFTIEDAVVFATRAQEKIGPTGDITNISQFKMRIGDKFYTRLIQVQAKNTMILQSNLSFVNGLGIKNEDIKETPPPLIKTNTGNTLSNIVKSKNYYILFPGAGSIYRRWPASRFVALSNLIYKNYGLIGLVELNDGEKDLIQTILASSDKHLLINICENSSLSELTERVRQARFVVSNDSAGAHIAAFVRTPSVCIVGGGYFGKFVPYSYAICQNRLSPTPVYHLMDCFGCNWKRPCMPFFKRLETAPCIDGVTVDQVWRQVEAVIKEKDK
jgi:ADP-heptose:LPS heptosyltransferase